MYFLVQLTMCFLLIIVLGNINSLPLLVGGELGFVSTSRGAPIHRLRRQGPIVQPSWFLNSEAGLFEDYNVRVTDEKLEETEEIREYIQETVDNGTYVVELDEGDFEEDEISADEEVPPVELSQPGPELEVEPKPTSVPAPKPEPSSQPEQKPKPKEHQTSETQPPNKSSKFFRRFKILPKRYSASSGSPLRTWFRKSFNH